MGKIPPLPFMHSDFNLLHKFVLGAFTLGFSCVYKYDQNSVYSLQAHFSSSYDSFHEDSKRDRQTAAN